MVWQSKLPIFLRLFSRSRGLLSGWTLIEMGTVAVVVGILASLAMPSFMGMKARMDARNGLDTLKQTLKQAQRNAIKMGKECRVQLSHSSNPPKIILHTDPRYSGCLPYREVPLENVAFHHNFPSPNIRFSYKGNSTNLGTMVVESVNVSGIRYCLVMSNMIGMMRSGNYVAAPPTVSATHCQKDV
ncbi:type II secretion system protein [Synechocystis sp. PCC 7339]|uniref:pilus assembly FimT family protein n=1 Tax=Synechocystis sp. PCC 7339 TaxID=2782213 RepID=UPI001CBCB5B3|nr:type II secretion system protein [Synechocystis sp. PCC 7339]UAJ72405.1 type II secretion system protein [Synechocystis sp. PCC 7339]